MFGVGGGSGEEWEEGVGKGGRREWGRVGRLNCKKSKTLAYLELDY